MVTARTTDRTGRHRPAALVVALGLVVALLAAGAGTGRAVPPAVRSAAAQAELAGRPNVVVVMADDMRVDDLTFAPNLRTMIARYGITFENSFSPYPLCCPARASFLTGQYSHNHRVFSHVDPWGYGSFDDSRTLATSLSAAGYRTGFIGKYLNGYGVDRSRVSGRPSYRYVPRGWDDWRAAIENPGGVGIHGGTYNYFDTAFNFNGRVANSFRGDYQSDVLGGLSVGMAHRFSRGTAPFFMYVNYVAPHHGGPWEPDDPRDVRDADGRPVEVVTPARPGWVKGRFDEMVRRASGVARTGEAIESDRSDKPPAVRRQARPLGRAARRAIMVATRQRAEAVHVMDRNIGRLVRELKRSGEWSNTVFMFTSDNGLILGEHGMAMAKIRAYEPSLRVPLLLTGPGLRTRQKRYDPITTIDLTATILDIANAPSPRRQDGISRWPSITTGDRGWTTAVVTEAVRTSGGQDPAFRDARSTIGIRTSRYSYTRYRDGSGELYDLVRDPRQDTNVHRSAEYAPVRRALAELWLRVKDCDAAECRIPLPPLLAADRATNTADTRTYWTEIRAGYGW